MGGLTHGSRRGDLAVALTAGLLLGLVPVAAAASPATFGTPSADSTFGTGVVFKQPVTTTGAIARVEILLTIADSIGPEVVEVPVQPAGSSTLTYTLDTSGTDHMIPNTPIVARWRLFAAGDATPVTLGPEVRVVYADDRFQWQTASGQLVRVHWYKGDAAFGAKALKLGEDEVRATSKLLGVTELEPADFFVYANVDEFYGAIGPGAHENVAGSAFPEIRTLLGLIPPDQIDDPQTAVRIPHEFVHLVFDTASKNPYHRPPRWLNEGLAVYQSEGYGASDRGLIRQAAGSGTLVPLDGLGGQFPNGDDFFLAYAESVAAVDFMIRTYGSDALVTLIRSYAEGRTDDEAFKAALGVDTTGFAAAWYKDVKGTPKARSGPQPAPSGPVPSAWLVGAPGGGSPPSAGPSRAAGSGGLAATSPGNPGAPGAPGAPGSAGGPATSGAPGWLWLVGFIALAVFIVAMTLAVRRRRVSERTP